MKAIMISFCLFLVAFIVSAQDAPENSLYVFGPFQEGVIYFNNGDSVVKRMNYNAGTEEFIFEQQGRLMALDHLDLVRFIKIGENVFEPIHGKFYHKIGANADGLYILYRFKVIPPGTPSAYGSDSNTSASTNWSSLADKNQLYILTIPEGYKIIRSKDFLLYKDKSLYIVNKYAQVSKLYPEKAKALKEYVKRNKLVWKKVDDLKKIIDFCCKSTTVN
ncbi:MAG: hypothetical protein M0P26_00235 [Bacteroidales bacterium]|nr:hypothetical protein [Bacteroidales bacterium]